MPLLSSLTQRSNHKKNDQSSPLLQKQGCKFIWQGRTLFFAKVGHLFAMQGQLFASEEANLQKKEYYLPLCTNPKVTRTTSFWA